MDTAASLVRIRPGLHTLETRVDDFEVRAVVVQGRGRVLVWDALAHPRQLEAAAPLVEGRDVVVAYSHADWDHVWGVAALSGVREVVAHRACAERFSVEAPAELERRRADQPGAWGAVRLVPPTRTFGRTMELDLGGLAVHLHHLAGHTPDSAVAWIPAWGVLLGGDTIETPLPVVNDAAAVPGWLAALRRWEAEPGIETVLPAHGPTGGRELLTRTAEYLEALLLDTPVHLPGDLDAFYRRTHEENVRLISD